MSSARRHRRLIHFLIGGVTLAVVGVSSLVSFHANQGLPFSGGRTLYVQLEDAAGLRDNNEVAVGGTQVGVISGLRPQRLASGSVLALVKVRLQTAARIPVDSRAAVRLLSPLGLKYLQLAPGHSSELFQNGATLPVSRTSIPVDIDQTFSTFDSPTRRAVAANELEYGDALAGRGMDLNQFIQGAPALAQQLAGVMANLSDHATHLPAFFAALDRFSGTLAPVADATTRLFTEMADTFGAISVGGGMPLQQTIVRSPPTLEVGTETLQTARPVLLHLAALSRELTTAAGALGSSLPPITAALRVATPVTRRSSDLSARLQRSLGALDRLAVAPATSGAIRGLTATVTSLKPTLRYLGPFITVCNYWNLSWSYFEAVTAPTSTGTTVRNFFTTDSPQDDALGSLHANAFVHGTNVLPGGVPEYLHENTMGGSAVTPSGQADCTAGQQGYTASGAPVVPDQRVYGRDVLRTSPLLGPAGPTYGRFDGVLAGRPLGPGHVPSGETFSARPGGLGRLP